MWDHCSHLGRGDDQWVVTTGTTLATNRPQDVTGDTVLGKPASTKKARTHHQLLDNGKGKSCVVIPTTTCTTGVPDSVANTIEGQEAQHEHFHATIRSHSHSSPTADGPTPPRFGNDSSTDNSKHEVTEHIVCNLRCMFCTSLDKKISLKHLTIHNRR